MKSNAAAAVSTKPNIRECPICGRTINGQKYYAHLGACRRKNKNHSPRRHRPRGMIRAR